MGLKSKIGEQRKRDRERETEIPMSGRRRAGGGGARLMEIIQIVVGETGREIKEQRENNLRSRQQGRKTIY